MRGITAAKYALLSMTALLVVLIVMPLATPQASSAGGSPFADSAATVTAGATIASPIAAASATVTANATTVAAAQTQDAVSTDPAVIAQGKNVFYNVAMCSNCHDIKQGIPVLGPSLKGIAERAATRKPGLTAVQYIRESILTPNAYVVEGFPANIMPQDFSTRLTGEDIDAVIAFVMSAK